jgi:hypothetical protein
MKCAKEGSVCPPCDSVKNLGDIREWMGACHIIIPKAVVCEVAGYEPFCWVFKDPLERERESKWSSIFFNLMHLHRGSKLRVNLYSIPSGGYYWTSPFFSFCSARAQHGEGDGIMQWFLFLSWLLDKANDSVVVPLILQQWWGELQHNYILKWVNAPIWFDLDMNLVEYNLSEFLIESSPVSLDVHILVRKKVLQEDPRQGWSLERDATGTYLNQLWKWHFIRTPPVWGCMWLSCMLLGVRKALEECPLEVQLS